LEPALPITLPPLSAAEIGKRRLEQYITEKLSKYWGGDDLCTWEFYTFLLEQAKKHQVDTSGFESSAYKDDKAEALKNHKLFREEQAKNEFHLPDRRRRQAQSTKSLHHDTQKRRKIPTKGE